MHLINDVASSEDGRVEQEGLQDVFWRDVASTLGVKRKRRREEELLDPVDIIDVPPAVDIKARWQVMYQHMTEYISTMKTFEKVTHAHTHEKGQETDTHSEEPLGSGHSVQTLLIRMQSLY